MKNVKEVIWITAGNGTLGIVLSDNGFEKKAYIKKVMGLDEESDTQDILNSGGKIRLEQAQAIVKHLTGKPK